MKWLKTEDPTFAELRINLKELGPKLDMMAKFHSEMAKLTEGLPKDYVALTKGASESLSIMAGVLCAASWQEILGMPEGKAQFDAASAALTSHVLWSRKKCKQSGYNPSNPLILLASIRKNRWEHPFYTGSTPRKGLIDGTCRVALSSGIQYVLFSGKFWERIFSLLNTLHGATTSEKLGQSQALAQRSNSSQQQGVLCDTCCIGTPMCTYNLSWN